MPRAAEFDIHLDRGADWKRLIEIDQNDGDDFSLEDAFMTFQVKELNGLSSEPAATGTCRIEGAAADGKVWLELPQEQGLRLVPGRLYEWDFFIDTESGKRRIFHGRLYLYPNVSQRP